MILIFLHLWFLKFFIRKCIQRIVEKWSEFSPASVSNRWTPSFPLVKWGSEFNLSRFFQTVTWGGGLQWSIFWGLCLGKAVMVMVPFFFFFPTFYLVVTAHIESMFISAKHTAKKPLKPYTTNSRLFYRLPQR